MELIPILSTIILVATISTFLLAIGAYILYKVRERKGQAAAIPQPAEVKAELITPAAQPAAKPAEKERVVPQPIYIEPKPVQVFQRQPIILEQPAPVAAAALQPRFTPRPQPYNAYRTYVTSTQSRSSQGQSYQPQPAEERKLRDSKFLKYTSEGYVPAKEDNKEGGELKWR